MPGTWERYTPEFRAYAVKRAKHCSNVSALAGELKIPTSTLHKWLKTPGVGRPFQRRWARKYPLELRNRIISHITNGDITIAEASMILGANPKTVYDWVGGARPEFRDNYLRRLFPDILGSPRSTPPRKGDHPPKGSTKKDSTNVG